MRLSRKALVVVAIFAVGAAVGVIADRTYWFGLRRRSLSVSDCDGMIVISPYAAWWMVINRDGSATLSQGRGIGLGGFGFSPILTMAMTEPEDRGHLPAGTFDFATRCRELLSTRLPTQQLLSDYDQMPFQIIFRPNQTAAAERADPVQRSRIRFDEVEGSIDHGIGLQLLEFFRKSAQDRGVWPKHFEAAWPHPPIPWAQDLGVPKNLKVAIQK